MNAIRVLAVVTGLLVAVRPVGWALEVGFGEVVITPKVGGEKEVWLAGYGQGRAATGVHDPLMARCVVLKDGGQKIALVSVDLVGLQYEEVEAIREELPGFSYVLISSTHNHEGPDVIGLWGKTAFHRGVDEAYLEEMKGKVVTLVKETGERTAAGLEVSYGTAKDESLLKDSRMPKAFDPVLRVLVFSKKETGDRVGMIVQWNSHPESLGAENTEITADFPWATVEALRVRYRCPVAYFTGTVGGLMAPPVGPTTFEYAEKHGKEVAALAGQAVESAEPLALTPMRVEARKIYIPVTNRLYRVAKTVGVLKRSGYVWTGEAEKRGEPLSKKNAAQTMAVETEVACLHLGDLRVAAIPGELYPELVYGLFQEPADPGADFPGAKLEPTVVGMMGERKWMLFGLANDEVGYLIPKRQWDHKKPFAYGRKKSQYGEVNACGPEAARIVMEGLRRCVAE